MAANRTADKKSVNTYGVRRRHGGKQGVLVKLKGQKYKIVPRAQGSSGSRAKISYECGQDKAYATKELPGRFKVQLPRKLTRHTAPCVPISTT